MYDHVYTCSLVYSSVCIYCNRNSHAGLCYLYYYNLCVKPGLAMEHIIIIYFSVDQYLNNPAQTHVLIHLVCTESLLNRRNNNN